jgi:hypothetical protein
VPGGISALFSIAGAGFDLIGQPHHLHRDAAWINERLSPNARAGFYDPNSVMANLVAAGSVVVAPGSAPTKIASKGVQTVAQSGVKPLLGKPTSAVSNVAARGTVFRNWNEFQVGTTGQFANRAEAGAAWAVYRDASGIATGVTRSTAARSEFLTGMAESEKAPSWMNQWLQQGKVPPGHHVDHIKPLSVGGADKPVNMRLLDIDMHQTHHRYYRPWE